MLLFSCPAVIILFASAVLHMLSFGILLLYLWFFGSVTYTVAPKKKIVIFVIVRSFFQHF